MGEGVFQRYALPTGLKWLLIIMSNLLMHHLCRLHCRGGGRLSPSLVSWSLLGIFGLPIVLGGAEEDMACSTVVGENGG